MDNSFHSVGVQPKSTYISKGTPRGVGAGEKKDPNKEYVKAKNPTVELYAERWEQGLDIWTGEPLEGGALKDWERQRDDKRRKRFE